MVQTNLRKIPTAFYRGYELGNGLNDWSANPRGSSPAVIKNALYASRAHIQVFGANLYWSIMVDAYRFGADTTPKAFHEWWDQFIRNAAYADPSLYSINNGELVFIEDKNGTTYTLGVDVSAGAGSMTLDDDTGISVDDILFIYDQSQTTNRSSDLILVTGIPGAGVINFTSLRPNASTLSYPYAAADNPVIYPVEAAWTGCYFEEMPELPPAQESSFGHFRKSIPMRFLSNGDRYPTP